MTTEGADGDTAYPRPLYDVIRDALRADIAAGRLKTFDQLPSETALQSRFSVSRITVRRAVGELAREGLAFAVPGKGWFVARPRAVQPLHALQGLAEAMAAKGRSIRNRVLHVREEPATAYAAERLRLPEGTPVTAIRRLRLLDEAPLSVEDTWLPSTLGKRLADMDLEGRDVFAMLEGDLAVRLGRADLVIGAIAAAPPLATLLEVTEGAPLLRIERLTHDAGGTPIDAEQLYYRADAFQYQVSVNR